MNMMKTFTTVAAALPLLAALTVAGGCAGAPKAGMITASEADRISARLDLLKSGMTETEVFEKLGVGRNRLLAVPLYEKIDFLQGSLPPMKNASELSNMMYLLKRTELYKARLPSSGYEQTLLIAIEDGKLRDVRIYYRHPAEKPQFSF